MLGSGQERDKCSGNENDEMYTSGVKVIVNRKG